MNKTILFALAAILATIPSSSLAQTYSYNFDSKHWTGSNDPTPPVIQLKEDWDCGLPPCSATVSGSVLPTSSGYSVTSVTVSNTNGKGVLIFSMTGPHGTFKAFGVTKPITGLGSYTVDFSFADPPYVLKTSFTKILKTRRSRSQITRRPSICGVQVVCSAPASSGHSNRERFRGYGRISNSRWLTDRTQSKNNGRTRAGGVCDVPTRPTRPHRCAP